MADGKITIKDWLTAVASELDGTRPEMSPESISSVLQISELNNVVRNALSQAKGDFSVTIYHYGDQLDDKAVAQILDHRLRTDPEMIFPIPARNVNTVIELVASLGLKTHDHTVRLVGRSGNSSVRLTVVHCNEGQNVFLRCTRMGSVSVEDLVHRRTLSSDVAILLTDMLLYYPRWTLVVCGPGGAGKSTMMNTLLAHWSEVSHSAKRGRTPGVAVMQGDAVDFIPPSYGVSVFSPSGIEDISSAARTCNTSVIVFGETTRPETARVFIESQAATTCAATTTHGDISVADNFLGRTGTIYIQMLPITDERIVVAAVGARIDRMLGVPAGNDKILMLVQYNILEDRFVITNHGEEARSTAEKLRKMIYGKRQ